MIYHDLGFLHEQSKIYNISFICRIYEHSPVNLEWF